jgi:hypothetical protein
MLRGAVLFEDAIRFFCFKRVDTAKQLPPWPRTGLCYPQRRSYNRLLPGWQDCPAPLHCVPRSFSGAVTAPPIRHPAEQWPPLCFDLEKTHRPALLLRQGGIDGISSISQCCIGCFASRTAREPDAGRDRQGSRPPQEASHRGRSEGAAKGRRRQKEEIDAATGQDSRHCTAAEEMLSERQKRRPPCWRPPRAVDRQRFSGCAFIVHSSGLWPGLLSSVA